MRKKSDQNEIHLRIIKRMARVISDRSGTCPLDAFDWSNCPAIDDCSKCRDLDDVYICWAEYYEEEERGAI